MTPYLSDIREAIDELNELIVAAVNAGERDQADRLVSRKEGLLRRLEALEVETPCDV